MNDARKAHALTCLCGLLWSPASRVALQVASAQLVICVLVFVDSIRAWSSGLTWLAAFNFASPVMVFTSDWHLGGQLQTAARANGSLLLGTVLGGLVCQFARLPGQAFTAYLCCFSAVAIAGTAVLRARMGIDGVVVSLALVVQLAVAQDLPPTEMWIVSVGILSFVNFAAMASCMLGAVLTLPSSSDKELSASIALLLQDLADQLGGFVATLMSSSDEAGASRQGSSLTRSDSAMHVPWMLPDKMLAALDDGVLPDLHPAAASLPPADPLHSPAEEALQSPVQPGVPSGLVLPETARAVRNGLWERTHPHRWLKRWSSKDTASGKTSQAASLLQGVVKVQAALEMAKSNVPAHGWSDHSQWATLTSALKLLSLRTAALECLLEGEFPLQSAQDLVKFMGRAEITGSFQTLYSYLSHSCAAMSIALRGGSLIAPEQEEAGAGAMEEELAGATQRAIMWYWGEWRSSAAQAGCLNPHQEVQTRALLCLTTLTNALLESLVKVQEALSDCQSLVGTGDAVQSAPLGVKRSSTRDGPHSSAVPDTVNGSSQAGTRQKQQEPDEQWPDHGLRKRAIPPSDEEASTSGRLSEEQQGLVQKDESVQRFQRPFRSWMERLAQQSAETHVTIKGQAARAHGVGRIIRGLLAQQRWAQPFIEGLLGVHVFKGIWSCISEVLKARTLSQWSCIVRSRTFAFGVKYWLMLSAAVVFVLAMRHAFPRVDASWHMLFILTTVAILPNEQVDLTWSKSIHRTTGTLFGSLFSYLVLLSPKTADDPYVLTALLCAWTFLCSLANFTRFRYGAFLALYTGSMLTLAQYNGDSAGFSYQYALARFTDVATASAFVVLVTSVAPWYLGDSALDLLGLQLQRRAETTEHILAVAQAVFGAQDILAGPEHLWTPRQLLIADVVPKLHHMMQALLGRLITLDAALQHCPIVTGHFTDASFRHIAQPCHALESACMTALQELMQCVGDVLSARPRSLLPAMLRLQDSVHMLIELRVAFKLRYWDVRGRNHTVLGQTGHSAYTRERSLDDAVQWMGFVYTCTKVTDMKASSVFSQPAFRVASQVAIAQLVVCVLTFINSVRSFSRDLVWVAAFNFPAPALVFTSNWYMGGQLLTSAQVNGDLLLGTALGGVVCQLASLPGRAHTAYLCCFSVVAVAIAALSRARLAGNGMMLALGLVVQLAIAQDETTDSEMWIVSVCILSWVNLVAMAASMIGAIIALPASSSKELQSSITALLQDLSVHFEGFISTLVSGADLAESKHGSMPATLEEKADSLLQTQQDGVPMPQGEAYSSELLSAAASLPPADPIRCSAEASLHQPHTQGQPSGLVLPETACAVRDNLWKRTHPDRWLSRWNGSRPASPARPQSSDLHLRVSKVLMAMEMAKSNIPAHDRPTLSEWSHVIHTLKLLSLRAAALECLLEGEYPLQSLQDLASFMQHADVTASFQKVYAYLASSCAAMADAARHDRPVTSEQGQEESGAAAMEEELAGATHRAIVCYWRRVQSAKAPPHLSPHQEVQTRALLCLTTLTNALLESLAQVQEALSDCQSLARPLSTKSSAADSADADHLPSSSTGADKGQRQEDDQQKVCLRRRANSSSLPNGTEEEQQILVQHRGAGHVPREQRPVRSWMERLARDSGEARVTVTGTADYQPVRGMKRAVAGLRAQKSLVRPFVEGLLGVHHLRELYACLQEAAQLTSVSKWYHAVRSHKFIFGIKYWAMLSAAVVLVLAMTHNFPGLDLRWHLLFIITTTSLLPNERVDVTWLRSIHRTSGTAIGCFFGYLTLFSPKTAGNPYVLTVLLCAWSFLCGLANFTPVRYGAFIACYTGSIVTLAQYNGESMGHTYQYALARFVDVAIASGFIMVLVFIGPWYLADTALDQLGSAAAQAGEAAERLYHQSYKNLQSRPQHSTGPDGLANGGAKALGNDLREQGDSQDKDGTAECAMALAEPIFAAGNILTGANKLWTPRILRIADFVPRLHHMMTALLGRLVTLEAALQHCPIVTGHFTDASFRHIAQPCHPQDSAAAAALRQLLQNLGAVLSASPRALLPAMLKLQDSVHVLIEARVAFKLRYWEVRGWDHAAVSKDGDSPYLRERSLDDGVQLLGFIYCTTKGKAAH
ncbi:hypothetical protein WJX73_009473 [Symbiochloris irregularis]|uniref:Integral membrane bound transporter domain-containing protein n=1 Tax=Symbiochloris irregularis TaxID=706552 RepID=A0AAW1PD28_9CHLO